LEVLITPIDKAKRNKENNINIDAKLLKKDLYKSNNDKSLLLLRAKGNTIILPKNKIKPCPYLLDSILFVF
jgi:hypothetical protein